MVLHGESVTTDRTATLPELLAILVAVGPEALLAAEGIEQHAGTLLNGHRTITSSERGAYGDEAMWAAWDALHEEHGPRLREMAEAHTAALMADNERRCEVFDTLPEIL